MSTLLEILEAKKIEKARSYVQNNWYSTLDTPKIKEEAFAGFIAGYESCQKETQWSEIDLKLIKTNSLYFFRGENSTAVYYGFHDGEKFIDYHSKLIIGDLITHFMVVPCFFL